MDTAQQPHTMVDRDELLDATAAGIVALDAGGRCRYCNRAAAELLATGRVEDLLGQPFHPLKEPDGSDHEHTCPLLRPLRDEGPLHEERGHMRRTDGDTVPVSYSAVPIERDGRTVGVAVSFIDMTREEEAEAALEARTRELQRSNAELERFAYAASHDLREPLRMIRSFGSLLERRCGQDLSADGRDYLGYIRDAAKRMHEMLTGLLEYSRVGRGGEAPEPQDMLSTAEEALRYLGPLTEETGADVRLEGDWPTLEVRRNEMVRLFQNLVSNALKHRAADRPPEVEIRAAPVQGEKAWRFDVRDNGVGFEPAMAEAVFQPFRRLDTRDREGSGIGLTLCRRIATQHGGSIEAHSPGPDNGARFRVILPAEGQEKAA